jgi:O-antigen/teichoic acid export membrane protein
VVKLNISSRKLYYINKVNGLVEQVAFSFFSFFLISVVAYTEESRDSAYFISVFSLVGLVYLLNTIYVIQPYFAYIASEGEACSSYRSSLILIILISIFTSSLSLIALSLFDFFRFDVYTIIILLLMPLGWSLVDFNRKINIYYGSEKYNYIYIAAIYIPVLFIFIFNQNYAEIFKYELVLSILMVSTGLFGSMIKLSIGKHRNLNKVIVRNWKFSKALILGAVFFWIYSQGIYIALNNYMKPSELVELRVIQNLTGLINVVMAYFEIKYLSHLSGEYKAEGLPAIALDARRTTKVFVILSIPLFLLVFLVLSISVSFIDVGSDDLTLFLLIFIISSLAAAIAKPAVVAIRFYRRSEYILSGHFLALNASILGVFFIMEDYFWLGIILSFVLPNLIFAIFTILKGLKIHENIAN